MSSHEITKGKIKDYILSIGADLVGFASIDRFEKAPEGHHPAYYLPEAKTVITFAKQFPNTVFLKPIL